MKIGELSKLSQISIRMLRYYEEAGLLSPKRTVSGYRQFEIEDIDRVKLIHKLNNAGLTLKVICKILPCWQHQNKKFSPCKEFKMGLNETLLKLDEQIQLLQQSRSHLITLLEEN
ncbi:MerR family transcriptional regulator [Gilliamella sp. W8128]|uniref:MerR family transcriptional regulator n=1 Tax=Gilliamella sp. W8128 TaxID=2751010 RepID=UPI0018DBBC50|nr:MerR family transcriptional regulator [Gilliamella sp. W8128]MBI0154093.1 MerR family transcriptional regulator [Gilliamella sp. W8128]